MRCFILDLNVQTNSENYTIIIIYRKVGLAELLIYLIVSKNNKTVIKL